MSIEMSHTTAPVNAGKFTLCDATYYGPALSGTLPGGGGNRGCCFGPDFGPPNTSCRSTRGTPSATTH